MSSGQNAPSRAVMCAFCTSGRESFFALEPRKGWIKANWSKPLLTLKLFRAGRANVRWSESLKAVFSAHFRRTLFQQKRAANAFLAYLENSTQMERSLDGWIAKNKWLSNPGYSKNRKLTNSLRKHMIGLWKWRVIIFLPMVYFLSIL